MIGNALGDGKPKDNTTDPKSETFRDIKIIISPFVYIFKRYAFLPNLEVVAQKISLPRP